MTEPLASTESGTVSMKCLEYGRFEKLLDGKNVLALGPGVTTQPETKSFVRTVVRECKTPLVLDADGLNAFAGAADALKERATQHLVLTPHPGEMARLLGKTTEEVQAHRAELARACAARWRCHLILKGHRTVIAAPDGAAFINSTGNPGMATGGSGDVLTGILAGLTAQFGTQEWLPLLAFGVFLHGLAGDLAAARHGEPSLIASDLVAELGAALEQLRRRP
jgi:NAD(P)H-hydrate epimerase